jgi:hypothetical protein
MKSMLLSTAASLSLGLFCHASAQPITAADPPTEATITGGPWVLLQGPASNAIPYNGYCVNGVQARNPGTYLMQPYYFPHIERHDLVLQGYFDYRPRNADEAVVAAWSHDAGKTWTFQQEAAELSQACPTDPTDPDNTTSPNGVFDNGQGHPFVLEISSKHDADGHHHGPQSDDADRRRLLYTLDRSDNNIDVLGLIVHELNPAHRRPLRGVPAVEPVPNGEVDRTEGLQNPDAILGVFRRELDTTILYVSKVLNGDTAFPADQQCPVTPAGALTAGRKANHDLVTLHVATTDDGFHFTDRGAVVGLSDPTGVDFHAIRYLGSGSVFPLADGRYGLLFGAGNCLDGDSDGFHFVGYAETTQVGDLMHWQIINGIDNPIVSTGQVTVASNTPGQNGSPTTIPATAPLGGYATWYNGRSYGPTVAYVDPHHLTMVFAGYSTPQPSLNLADYRSIGVTTITTSSEIDPF